MLFFKTIATSSIEFLLNEKYQFLSLNKQTLIEELKDSLENCILEFEQLNTIEILESTDIPFYHSAILLIELLNFRFKQNEKFEVIQNTFDKNTEIIYNSNSEIAFFMNLLDQEITKTEFLKKLEINKNYTHFLAMNA